MSGRGRRWRVLDHAESRFAVTAERAALAALGGGCQVPIGAYCRRDGEQYRDFYRISGCVSSPDGATVLRARRAWRRTPQELGRGAGGLAAQAGCAATAGAGGRDGHDCSAGRTPHCGDAGRRQSGGLRERLEQQGAEVLLLPTIEIVPPDSYEPLDAALRDAAAV